MHWKCLCVGNASALEMPLRWKCLCIGNTFAVGYLVLHCSILPNGLLSIAIYSLIKA